MPSNKVTFDVKGIKGLEQLLKGYDNAFNQKVIEGTFRQAAKPLVEKAKLLAPEGPTGNLVDSIGTFASRSRDRKAKEKAGIWVGPRIKGGYRGYHAHLVEFGTEDREIKTQKTIVFSRNGVNVVVRTVRRGRMPAKPFMVPAFLKTKDQIDRGVQEGFEKIFKRRFNKYKPKKSF